MNPTQLEALHSAIETIRLAANATAGIAALNDLHDQLDGVHEALLRALATLDTLDVQNNQNI